MGTSGAFGGSETKSWKTVRQTLDDVLGQGGPPGEPTDNEENGDPTADDEVADGLAALVEQIAQALQADDPRARPNRRLSNASPSAAIHPLLEQLGRRGGRGGRGGRRGGPTSGRRDLAGSSRRAGRALYAGYAAASGDANALEACGINPARLQGRPWFDQVLIITEEILGSSSNADEQALKSAVVQILVTLDPDAPRAPKDAIRDVIAAYVGELASVELTAALTAREITDQQAQELEDEVREYIEIRRDAIAVPDTGLTTIQDFEDAAELLMQEVLLILGRPEAAA